MILSSETVDDLGIRVVMQLAKCGLIRVGENHFGLMGISLSVSKLGVSYPRSSG